MGFFKNNHQACIPKLTQQKVLQCFDIKTMFYIIINTLYVVYTLNIVSVCVCEMWFVVEVAIKDFNWYVMIMIIMMILIWDDNVNKDHVNMNCYY